MNNSKFILLPAFDTPLGNEQHKRDAPFWCEVPYSNRNRLNFRPITTGNGICFLNKNGMFKKRMLDRYDLRPLLNNRHLAEPPCFSVYTTFKGAQAGRFVDIGRLIFLNNPRPIYLNPLLVISFLKRQNRLFLKAFSVRFSSSFILHHQSLSGGWGGCRVSSKQTITNFGSNRNKPKQDLFRVCFGFFCETKNKIFRFVSVFPTFIETTETNRTVS